jgi:hypothetical protein
MHVGKRLSLAMFSGTKTGLFSRSQERVASGPLLAPPMASDEHIFSLRVQSFSATAKPMGISL